MLFKSAEIFFLSATLHTQKNVKERAYILTCYQALLKAQLFFLFIYILNKREKEDYSGHKFFICLYFNSLNTVLYWHMATFIQDHNKISLTQEHITEQGWNY